MSDIRHKLKDTQAQLLKLITRSPELEGEWRQVSDQIWKAVEEFAHKDLTEIDPDRKRIRLTSEGHVVLKYIL